VTLAVTSAPVRPLDPIAAAVAAVRGDADTFGIADGLVVTDPTRGWTPASALVGGTAIPDLLSVPTRIWGAQPHAAATLAYKQYTYWLTMPAVLGWAVANRVPLLSADNVAVRLDDEAPYVTIGMLRPAVAVLPDDPAAGHPDAVVVDTPAALLGVLKDTLLDRHVSPLVAATREHVRVGAHTLYGQLAAAVAYVLSAAAEHGPYAPVPAADAVLDALGLTGLAALCHTDGELQVRRRTCCLAFVVPGLDGRLCPGCCVRR
jgi:hypothetical protein